MATPQIGIWDQPPAPRVAPDPPTGPATETRRAMNGFRGSYEKWRDCNADVFRYIEAMANVGLANGARRISTKGLVEMARVHFKRPINNTFTAYIADDLVAEHPELLGVIERRRRVAHHSPNDPGS